MRGTRRGERHMMRKPLPLFSIRIGELHNVVTFSDHFMYSQGMRYPAGVKRDWVRLERRRLQSARLLDQSVHKPEVARPNPAPF